jgi:hypothetical protein
MKERPTYEPIPDELVKQAASADIAAYLAARGEQLIPAGQGRYKLADHDSLVITGSMYYWNSRRGEGNIEEHGNAIKFLRAYYGMGFREAVMELSSGAEKNVVLPPPAMPEQPPRPFDLADIDLVPDMERVTDYLTNTRGLSDLLVKELIANRNLFQEAQTNNAIFPIYDDHKTVGAEVVGTMPQQRFKQIKTGSKYGCGYNLSFGEQTAFALFFESAIDLLSFVELSRMRGKTLEGCRLTSMMGLKPNIVERTMQGLEGAQPYLCVDNDEAGQNFIKAMGLKSRRPDPAYKDWNDQLRAIRKA